MPQDQKRRQAKILKKRRKEKAKKKRMHSWDATEHARTKAAVQNAGKYPIADCLINPVWRQEGIVPILISRKQPNGNYVFAVFLVDLYCLGVKNAYYRLMSASQYADEFKPEFIEHNDAVSCSIQLAHQIIYGAIDYAKNIGFSPAPEFAIAQHMLEPRETIPPNEHLEFGKDGMPLFVSGPHDKVGQTLRRLRETVGEGNFHYIIGGPTMDNEAMTAAIEGRGEYVAEPDEEDDEEFEEEDDEKDHR